MQKIAERKTSRERKEGVRQEEEERAVNTTKESVHKCPALRSVNLHKAVVGVEFFFFFFKYI